jgi:hypothetical protein
VHFIRDEDRNFTRIFQGRRASALLDAAISLALVSTPLGAGELGAALDPGLHKAGTQTKEPAFPHNLSYAHIESISTDTKSLGKARDVPPRSGIPALQRCPDAVQRTCGRCIKKELLPI